jgi:hypothetical protein
MYWITVEETGEPREAEEDEVEGINEHRKENPKCNGTQVMDRGGEDQTLWGLRQRLWCKDCKVRVPIPR